MTLHGRGWLVVGGLALAAGLMALCIDWTTAPRGEEALEAQDDVEPSAGEPILLGQAGVPPKIAKAAAEPAPRSTPAAPVLRQVIRGRVTDIHDGRALAGARVLACVGEDGWDLRGATEGVVATTSQADGSYELTLELPALPAQVVLTAQLDGYASPHTAHTPEDQAEVSMAWPQALIKVAGASTIDLPLYPGITVAGTVVDHEGVPIGGVDVLAGEQGEGWSSYIENTRTDASGRFRIYDLVPKKVRRADAKGWAEFTHPLHTQVRLEDVYGMTSAEQRSLRIVMPRGLRVLGTLAHVDGTPAAGVLVTAFRGDPNSNRRGAVTDEHGKFALDGLSPGLLVLQALDAKRLSYVRMEIRLLRSEDDFELRLGVLPDAHLVERERVLGVEFIAMPPAMHAALGMYKRYHLLITEIGADAPAAFRERVRPGTVIWGVGGHREQISSRRDLIEGLVARVDWRDKWRTKGGRPLSDPCSAGVTLGFRSADMEGTVGCSFEFSRKQLEELRAWLAAQPEEK